MDAQLLPEHSILYARRNFPDYAKLHGAGVIGIPGFWQEPSGRDSHLETTQL